MDITKTSDGEFLHPMIVPWFLFLGASDGQNILSNPFPATIISLSADSKGTAPPQLLTSRNAVNRRPRMLQKMFSKVPGEQESEPYQVRLARCQPLNGQNEKEEEDRKDGKSLCRSGLEGGRTH